MTKERINYFTGKPMPSYVPLLGGWGNEDDSEKCLTCGTPLWNDCPVCGAPVCCPKCCEETTRQSEEDISLRAVDKDV